VNRAPAAGGAGPETSIGGDADFGPYRAIWWARAADEYRPAGAQYGGTVSALLGLALGRGSVEAAVVVRTDGRGRPRPFLARDPEEVASAAGSRYVAVPSLAALAEARRQGIGKVAVVGRPCQVQALRNWRGQEAEKDAWLPQAGLVIGLFCFWSLSGEVMNYLERRVEGPVLGMDIPPERVVVRTAQGEVSLPLAEIRPYIKPACQSCGDPTAEGADLSVGSTEADPQWNTLIVRTPRGQELVETAVAERRLELRPYPEERLPLLRTAVANKKQRVLAGMKEPVPAANPGVIRRAGEGQ